VVKRPKIVAQANGIRTLLQISINPKYSEEAESIILAFLYVFDNENRKFIRPIYDIQVFLQTNSRLF
jgi:hypothetical protein